MFTRKDYLNNVCDHETYYRQFVTAPVVALVEMRIGRDKVMTSSDPHLNDIPLRGWDGMWQIAPIGTTRLLAEANGTGGVSLSDYVCVFKAAAQMMREGLA